MENKQTKIFNCKLKDARIRKGLTLTELANELGLSPKQVSRYEKDSIPKPETLYKLKKIFNEDFNQYLEEDYINGNTDDDFTSKKVKDNIIEYFDGDDLDERAALLRVVVNHLAKLEAIVYNRPLEDCMRDILLDTTLVLTEKRSGS